MKKLFIILSLLLSLSFSATLLVPTEYSTIQSGINASADGDTILVSAGTYYENINFNGKNISVIGEDRETTIIDGGQNGSVVVINNDETEDALLMNFTITNGSAYEGGGIFINNSFPSLSNLEISNNAVSYQGGGIYCEYSNSSMNNIDINSNYAGNAGGGMYLYENNSNINNINILFNNTDGQGGGLVIHESSPNLNNFIINNNSASTFGGGVKIRDNSNPIMSDITISGNSAENGGAISSFNSNASISTSTISNNSSNRNAGGIYINTGGNIEIVDNLIINNSAVNDGGGLLILSNSDVNIINTTIANNLSSVGGGIVCGAASPILTNVTIANNTAENSGGGIFSYQASNPILINSIVAFNLPEEIVFRWDHDPTAVTISYSNILGGEEEIVTNNNGTIYWEEGNINIDPLFCDIGNGDFTVRSDSPVLGTGENGANMGAFGIGCEPMLDCNGMLNGDAVVDACGVCGGDNSTCPTITDIDGNVYATVQIGDQNWMKQNLKVTQYNNGDAVQLIYDEDEWDILTVGSYSFYDNDSSNIDKYGNMYNWFVTESQNNICPENWHVPSTDEFKELETFLGMSPSEIDLIGWRGSAENIGGSLKAIGTIEDGDGLWFSPNLGADNSSGLSILPSGKRNNGPTSFEDLGLETNLWTSSQYDEGPTGSAYIRVLSAIQSGIFATNYGKRMGFSIRCLQDDIEGCTHPNATNYDETANVDDGSCTYPDNGDYSLSFDGVDDYVEVADSDELDGMNQLTIQFWVQLDEYSLDYEQGYVFLDKSQHGQNVNQIPSYSFYTHHDVDALTFLVKTENAQIGANLFNYSSYVNLNQWYLFSGVYDGQTIQLYINGTLMAESALTGSLIQTDYPLHFANSVDTPNSKNFNGDMDEVSIWDIVLSESDIQSFMSTPPTGNESGLVGYWNFNAGESNILYDHSGNGNHGTLMNMDESSWVCNEMDACGVCGGDNSTCPTITDIDGNVYATVQIGNQNWMKQNLKVTHYNDGNEIPTGVDNSTWASTTDGAYAVYDDDSANAEAYGNLYNWYSVNDDRGICPNNWHIPSEIEFSDLIDYLDGEEFAGGKMKESGHEHWNYFSEQITIEANNESGFSGLPAGYRSYQDGGYYPPGNYGYYWSSSAYNEDRAAAIKLNYDNSEVLLSPDFSNRGGFSIRCLETVPGCIDESACNYDELANTDDGSCLYNDCAGECGGTALEDNCGTCDSDTSNDCVQDCADVWGGDAEVDDCSVCAGDNSACCTDLAADAYFVGSPAICEYTDTLALHEGANLVSFWVLPDNSSLSPMFDSIYDTIDGIIGEGVAASPNPVLGWVGSLQAIDPLDGYWLKVNEDIFFTFTGTQLTPSDTPYGLYSGANLISFPYMGECAIADAIPDEFEPYIAGIISEGVAASPNPVLGWVGSLTAFQGGKGYWMKTNADIVDFNFDISNCSNSLSRSNDITIAEDFNQSTEQAFYFIEDIENIELGDIVSAYCNDIKVGSREWIGAYTDIPAMGNDNSDLTKDYCTSESIPTFRVEKPSGETYALTGDIPSWESNGLHMLSTLQEAIILPESYSLAAAYPNPFNPTTTINFAIPADTEVSIAVYSLQGREVVSLASGSYDAGYHSVIWNADTHSSGVYFVKMVAGSYVNTQKLMLVK